MSEPRVPDNLDTTVSYPEAAGWGVVTGRFVYGSPDGPDAKEFPDAAPIQGTMEVTASREIVTFRGDPPTTFYMKPVVCKLSGNGFSSPAGKPYLVLIPTDRGGIAESGWNYTFTFRNKAGDLMHEVTTSVPQGEIVDLTLVLDTEPGAGPGTDPMVSMTSTLTLTAFTLTKKADEMEKMLDEARQSAAESAQSAKNSEDSAKTAESKIVEAAASAAASESSAKAAEESAKASSTSAKNALDALNTGREENKTAIAEIKAENAMTLESVKSENSAALAQAQASLDEARTEAANAAGSAAESATQASASAQDSAAAKQAAQEAATSSQESKQASVASAQSASESALSAQTAKDSAVQAAADVEKAKTLIATSPIEFKWETIQEAGATKVRGSWRRTGETDWRPVGDIASGADGASVTAASVNAEGELVIELSKGGPINAGLVKGADGKDGTIPKIVAGTVTPTQDGSYKIETPENAPNEYRVDLWLPGAGGGDEKAVNGLIDNRLSNMRYSLAPRFKDIFISNDTVFGICRDGTAYSCGNSYDGASGNGNTYAESPYLDEVLIDATLRSAESRGSVMIALDTEGCAWGSGQPHTGRIPPQIGNKRVLYPVRVHPDKRFKSAHLTGYDVLAVDVDGKVWRWGRSVGYEPVQLPFTQPIESIMCKENGIMIALDTNGKVWTFGYGLLGDGQSYHQADSPVPVLPNLTFKKIESKYGSSMALDTSGNLWAWGDNDRGQLGIGNKTSPITTPTKVVCDKPIVDFDFGSQFSAMLTSDGKVYTCGINTVGQQGNSSNIYTENQVPTLVDLQENAISIACGSGFSVVRMADERIASWGSNGYGQLGRGISEKYAATPDTLNWTRYKKVAVGEEFVVAIPEYGKAQAWGRNDNGQLGNGTTEHQNSPVTMSII